MRLSKQSIRRLCEGDAPMIHPFEPGKVRVQGVSKGLSHASYDASIAHDLILGRHPGYVIRDWVRGLDLGNTLFSPWSLIRELMVLAKALRDEPPAYALAHTVEDFRMPANVGGDVADKSTFARVFVSAYNTFFDPGFHGNATLELVNDSDKRVEYKAGQGVCQFIFTWLDEPTEEPYSGKYQWQTKRPQEAIFEPDGAPYTPEELAENARNVNEWRDAQANVGVRAVMYKSDGKVRRSVPYVGPAEPDDRGQRVQHFYSETLADAVTKTGQGVLHKWVLGQDSRNRHEIEANQDRLDRHRAKEEKPVHYDGEVASHHRRNAAEATLKRLGYTWNGGVEWKPPLGKVPAYIQESDLGKISKQGYGIVREVQGTDEQMSPELDPSRICGNGRVALDPHPAPVAETATPARDRLNLIREKYAPWPVPDELHERLKRDAEEEAVRLDTYRWGQGSDPGLAMGAGKAKAG